MFVRLYPQIVKRESDTVVSQMEIAQWIEELGSPSATVMEDLQEIIAKVSRIIVPYMF
jgi:hypothetical protein